MLSSAEISIFSLRFSQAPFAFLLTFKFFKIANLLEILNLILFSNLQLTCQYEIISLHIKLLCWLFTYCQSFPNFCNHHIVISTKVSSSERLHIEYTWKPSAICQYGLSLIVSLTIREVQVYLWMYQCGNILLLMSRFFNVAKFTTVDTMIFTVL